MPVKSTGRNEEHDNYYDRIYKSAHRNGVYDTTRFNSVYNTVLDWINHFSELPHSEIKIIECGCGTGALANMLMDAGYWYHGFDFSSEALKHCSKQVKDRTWRATAYSKRAWDKEKFNTVVAIETFEHLDDHRVLRWVPKETRIIFSVPNFNSRSHLRTYEGHEDIQSYYRGKIAINCFKEIKTQKDKIITVCDAIKLVD